MDAMRFGMGSAVIATMCGTRPLRLRMRFKASVRAFCARSLLSVHLQEMLACSSGKGFWQLIARSGLNRATLASKKCPSLPKNSSGSADLTIRARSNPSQRARQDVHSTLGRDLAILLQHRKKRSISNSVICSPGER